MAVLSVLYPHRPGERFDERDYVDRHISLVRELWGTMGLTGIRLLRGAEAPGGGAPPYQLIALVSFETLDALHTALLTHREEIFASIRHCTDIQPVVQVSEEFD